MEHFQVTLQMGKYQALAMLIMEETVEDLDFEQQNLRDS